MEAVLEQQRQKAPPSSPRVEAPRRQAWKIRLFAILILAAVAAAGYWTYLHFRDRVTTDDAQVDGHIAPIAAKIPGSIAEILVEDNQGVKAGQVLLRIDARDYEARVAQARAALEMAAAQAQAAKTGVPLVDATTSSGTLAAQAQLAAANADLLKNRFDYERSSSAELSYARANVDTQHATYVRAQADLERMKALVTRDEISKFQYDSYVAAAAVAQAQLDAARERLAASEKQAAASKAAFDTAKARVDQARAALDQTRASRRQVDISASQAATAAAAVSQARANLQARELELGYTAIAAPVDGVVTRKTAQIGQIVQPGQSLMTIIPLEDVWVTANFKETQLAHVRPGQKAQVRVDMYGRAFAAHVDSVAGATGTRLSLLPPENAAGNYVKVVQRIPVKLVFDTIPDGVVFRPGMNVIAAVTIK